MKKLMTILTIVLAVLTQAAAQTPEELIAIRDAYAQAMNDHDLDLLMSFYTDDVIYDLVNSPPPAGKEIIRLGFEMRFQIPGWHTDEGRVFAVDNIVVVDHNAVTPEGPGGAPLISPHLDIYEFEGEKIKKITTYGDNLMQAIKLGQMPAPEMPELVPAGEIPGPEPTGLSPLEANAELVMRWNSHDAASVARMDHADARIFAAPLEVHLDRVSMVALNEQYFVSFPDVKLEVVRTIDLGQGWILTELVSRGTHLKSFMGVPPAGYPVEIRVVWLTRFDSDGLVTDMSFFYDGMTLLTQMTEEPEYSPAGHWIVTVPSPAGNLTFLHTVIPQEKMGVPYAGTMEQVNANPTFFGTFPEAEFSTNWITLTVRTGRNTCTSTMIVYSTRQGDGPVSETVLIGVGISKWTLTGPATNDGTTMYSVYMADQDADGDGLPDEGQVPVICQEFTFTSRRPQMMLPCVPEMPDPGQ